MHIILYLDIYFLMNFIVDLYGLFLTGCLLRQPVKWSRLIGGAIFGTGMLLPFMMYPESLMGIKGLFWSAGISMGAVWIALGKKGGLIRKWVLTTTILILLGGIMNGLHARYKMPQMSLGIWMVFFMGSAGAVVLLISGMKEVLHKRNTIYPIEIHLGEKTKRGRVLLDTGNLLQDGLFGKPVILLSYHFLTSIFTPEELSFIQNYQKKGCIEYSKLMLLKTQRKICFHEITYQSVGNPSGKLLCFVADDVLVSKQQRLVKQPIAIGTDELFVQREYDGLMFADGME